MMNFFQQGKKTLKTMLCLTAMVSPLTSVLAADQVAYHTPSGTFTLPSDKNDQVNFYFKVEADPGPGTAVYWAQQYWFNNGKVGYLGMQHNLPDLPPYEKQLLFSIWDAKGSVAGTAPYAKAGPFGGEGEGYNVSMRFNWQPKTTYRFALKEESPGWWRVDVTDMTTNTNYYMGKINVGDDYGKIGKTVQTFTEVFIGGGSCTKVPYSRVRFSVDSPLGPPVNTNPFSYGEWQLSNCPILNAPGRIAGVNFGSSSQIVGHSLLHQKALYNGPQHWGDFDRKAEVGTIFKYDNPYNRKTEYFRLASLGGDGRYWYFPINQKDNSFWEYLGNDDSTIYNRKVKTWGSNDRKGTIGDIYIYANPYNHTVEYFKLQRLGGDGRYWYFPINKKDNWFWKFLGTNYPSK